MKTIYFLLNKKQNKRKRNFSTISHFAVVFFFIVTSTSSAGDKIEDDFLISNPAIQGFSHDSKEKEILPSGKIRVFVDKNRVKSIVVGKQDCSIMRNEIDLYGFGFKFGGLLYGLGPEIYYGHSLGVNWNWANQIMVAEFQELCTRFNTGRLSQEEYSKEVYGIINRSRNYKIELEKRLKKKKDSFFKEMDNWNLPNT
tara:strand:+ start:6366 stop:6959 length:594 start_codon:yes stop_codon:yes gene_type:complete